MRSGVRRVPSCAPLLTRSLPLEMRATTFPPKSLRAITSIGDDPGDSPETRLRKRYLVLLALMILPAGLIWGSIYWYFDEHLAALVPWAYVVVSAASLVLFAATRNYSLFRLLQLGSILVAPFVLGLLLGGFVSSSAVVLWSLLAPVSALIFYSSREALYWFAGYLLLVLLSSLAQPYLRVGNELPPLILLAFFLMNIGTISAVAFLLLYLFI